MNNLLLISLIANYNAEEDEYLAKKKSNGFVETNSDIIHDRPICEQPGRQDSSHIIR